MKLSEINWVLVIVIGTLVIYGARGHREGFIRTVFGMFSFMIALAAGSMIGPALSDAIKSNEKILPYITQSVDEDELTLPELLKDALNKHNTKKDLKEMAVEHAQDYVKVQVANWVINALSFVIIFIIAFILLWYLCHTLNIISKLPILNGLNKTAGILVGVLRGFITIWMWCIVLTVFSTTHICQVIFTYINESELLSLIYNNNLLFEIGKIIL